MSRNASKCLTKSVKHGIGRLTASADRLSQRSTTTPIITRLTRVAHKAPTRLIPVKKTSIHNAGAAVCALSNYGAGMLQGDSAELSVHVEAGAKLGLITQGAARIYTQRVSNVCKVSMHATVEKDAVLVFAPDPCTMFASSSYSQTQEFEIHSESSIALIDWFSSGRFKNKERWEFDSLQTRTKLNWLKTEITKDEDEDEDESRTIVDKHDNMPFLQDSTYIDLRLNNNQMENHDIHGVSDFNCFASLILYGEHIQSVKDRCLTLSDTFAAKYTRIRERDQCDKECDIIDTHTDISTNLAGRVIMGVSQVNLPGKPSDAYVVRLAGKSNEDIYRVFHDCLIPMAPSFGIEFYKDRILAQRSEIPKKEVSQDPIEDVYKATETKTNTYSPQKLARKDPYPTSPLDSMPTASNTSFWSIMMLADSGLPTGSFAHSAGLEAAAQLGMLRGEEDVRNYIQAATRSSMQLLAPFLICSLRIVQRNDGDCISIRDSWDKLNRECSAVMVTNKPACSASIDQGKSLARVASQWLGQESSHLDILECLKSAPSPHIAPTLGVIGGLLGLDEIQICRLFAYCMARDIVSAAVRLSLVGPLASVPLLHNVQESAEDGIRAVYAEILKHPDDPLLVAAASAPVIEAIHPCHEILQVRLFRS